MITIERTLPAEPQRVYDAWTRPELMVRWYCPNPELSGDEDVKGHAEGWEGCFARLPTLFG